ncbi:MAG: DUF924 family protein [Hyphomicrobiaceae bacterium]
MARATGETCRMDKSWIGDVLHFWFAERTPKDWFEKSWTVDLMIRDRFRWLHAQLAQQVPPDVLDTADGALAAILVLDQFSRHLYRGDGRAFASDPQALAIASLAVDRGYDRRLSSERRQFLYLPFEHSEDRSVQARSMALFGELGVPENLHYAWLHKVIIDRFGRFPHRNAALGRASTPEEIAFLSEPNSSF